MHNPFLTKEDRELLERLNQVPAAILHNHDHLIDLTNNAIRMKKDLQSVYMDLILIFAMIMVILLILQNSNLEFNGLF